MAATLMDGKALAARVRAEVAEELSAFGPVGLATVLVGEDPASEIYIRMKHKAAGEVGITAHDHHLPADTGEDDLLALVEALNGDDAVDGILVQLPLPDHIDEELVLRTVDPIKDVDGFHPFNAGQLYLDRPTLVPRDADRRDRAPRRVRDPARRCAGGRRRPQLDRRQARGDAAARAERDRHDLPLPHGRPRRGDRARPTCSSPPSAARA